jgi:hypothetical protein
MPSGQPLALDGFHFQAKLVFGNVLLVQLAPIARLVTSEELIRSVLRLADGSESRYTTPFAPCAARPEPLSAA